jgi:hypothetical protein
MTNPFAPDSIYAQPGLTQMVRQYDRNPGQGETILTATAKPSPKAVLAENNSLAAIRDEIYWRNAQGAIIKTLVPSKAREALTSHSDAYLNFFDSTSIKRPYTG